MLLAGCVINPSFHKLPTKEQAALRPEETSVAKIAAGQQEAGLRPVAWATDSIKVYKFDSKLLQQYTDSSPNEFTHLYVYGSFCKPCAAELPGLVRAAAQNQTANLLLVSPQSYVALS